MPINLIKIKEWKAEKIVELVLNNPAGCQRMDASVCFFHENNADKQTNNYQWHKEPSITGAKMSYQVSIIASSMLQQ
jgi:hypothetical protein